MNTQVTDQQIDDILATALDGGITYWADRAVVVGPWPQGATFASDAVSRNSSLEILDQDGEGLYYLTKSKLLAGILAAANHRGLTVERFLEEHDSEDADLAVQYALFGELVYG